MHRRYTECVGLAGQWKVLMVVMAGVQALQELNADIQKQFESEVRLADA